MIWDSNIIKPVEALKEKLLLRLKLSPLALHVTFNAYAAHKAFIYAYHTYAHCNQE